MAKFVITGLLCGFLAASLTAQENGVTPEKIIVGQAAALQGQAMALGVGMQAGLNAAFAEVNTKGGVKGKKIELLSINDGYEPATCELATKKLIEKDKVFALIGAVGTPTSKVAVPIAQAAGVPFIAPFTGAELLRTPFNRTVVNLRASYYQEMEAHAKVLVDGRGMKKIACLYQNDAFGQAGLAGIKLALERRKMELCASATFERNTVAVRPGLVEIGKSAPDAIIIVGPYKPCAEFIKQAKADPATKNAVFATISFVGTEALVDALKGADGNVYVSQVVPFPWDTANPLVASYQAAMKGAGAEKQIGFISLEGYVAGRLFAAAMNTIEGDPTREKFLQAIDKASSLDLDGMKLSFGPADHQGSDEVFMTVLEGGKVMPTTVEAAGTKK